MQYFIDFITIEAAIWGSLAVCTLFLVAGARVWGSFFPLPPVDPS